MVRLGVDLGRNGYDLILILELNMDQKKRMLLAFTMLVVLVALVLGVDYLQRRRVEARLQESIPAGSIPIIQDGELAASFVPDDLAQLDVVSFVDDEEGKTQEGWMLRDVILLYLDIDSSTASGEVTISSSSRNKSVTLDWATINDPGNMVMFDLSGRGTLKLVSKVSGYDTRDDWVQDVDRIDVQFSE
jgi:hypothetical protein